MKNLGEVVIPLILPPMSIRLPSSISEEYLEELLYQPDLDMEDDLGVPNSGGIKKSKNKMDLKKINMLEDYFKQIPLKIISTEIPGVEGLISFLLMNYVGRMGGSHIKYLTRPEDFVYSSNGIWLKKD